MDVSSESVEPCRECGLRLLTQRAHSVGELRRKLASRRFPRNVIAEVIADFERVGLLDDRAFARLYSEQRLQGSRAVGERRVRQELQKRLVSAEIIEATLAGLGDIETGETDETARALRVAEAKLRVLMKQEKDPQRQREKLARFLASRGFSASASWDAIERALSSSSAT